MSNTADTNLGRTYADYMNTKKHLMIANVALSVVVLTLLFLLITKGDTIVMVPPQLQQEAIIANGEGNEEYQKRFAFAFTNVVGNVRPKTVDFIVDTMYETFSPALRERVGVTLKNEARILRDRDLEQEWDFEDMLYSPKKKIVWVWGKRTIKGDGVPPMTSNYTYEWQIKPIDGLPRITHFKSYDGHPMMQEMRQRHDELKPRYYTKEQETLASGLEVTSNQAPAPEVNNQEELNNENN